MKGQLSEGVLPGILRDLYVGRQTGLLRCAQGQEQRNVRFRRGHIVRADTNVQGRQLGELMVDQGWISPDQLARATETVKATGRRLGEVLIESRAITPERLEDALALHVRDIVARVFTWTDGTYEFQEEPETAAQEATLKLSTGELILEAVRQVNDPDVVRYALGDIERVLSLSSDPLLRFQNVALSPTDGFVLSRVDGTHSAREVMQMIPLPPEETQKSLFGLLCTGIIEVAAEAPKKSRTATEPARTIGSPAAAPPAPLPRTDHRPPAPSLPPSASPLPAPAVAAVPAPAAAPPAAALPATSPAIDGRRNEITEAFEGLKTRNHFEVLGLSRSANEQQVKEAYFRLARRFHPDAHHDATLSDLVDQLEAVFIRLGEAYETLKNPRLRADYEERLGRLRPRPEGGAGPLMGVSGPPAGAPAAAPSDPEDERRAAEEAVRRANWYFEKEKYYDAIQLLEPMVEKLSGKLQTRARLVLAKSYVKNPKWLKRGEETLQTIVHDDPQNVDAYYLLGTIYRDRGLKARATSMIRKVLDLKPDHEEALAAIGPLTADAPPPAEAPPGGGGLFGKLFRKG